MSRPRNAWVLPVSLLLALLLGLVPLPALLQPVRPYWLALVLAYWVLEEPEKVGLGVAFLLGVVADLAFGGLLGEQAMRLAIFAFILDRFRARLRFFPLSQQALGEALPLEALPDWRSAGCWSTTAWSVPSSTWCWARRSIRGRSGGRRCWACCCGRRCISRWTRCACAGEPEPCCAVAAS